MRQLGIDFWFGVGVSMLAWIALLVLPLSILVTLGVIRWFRWRVARSMRATAATSARADPASQPAPPGALRIEWIGNGGRPAAEAVAGAGLVAASRRGRWRLAAIHGAAAAMLPLSMGMAYAVMFTKGDSPPIMPVLLLIYFFVVFATPTILVVLVLLDGRPLVLALGVLALVALHKAVDASLGANMSWLWLLNSAAPSAAVVVLSGRRLRAVGPVVFAALLLLLYGLVIGLIFGALYALDVIGPVRFVRDDLASLPIMEAAQRYFGGLIGLPWEAMTAEISRLASQPLQVIGVENEHLLTTGVELASVAIALAVWLLGASAAWVLMRWLARRYEQQRASDQMLTVDVLMLLFAIPTLLIRLVPFEGIAAAGVVVGMLGYKLAGRALLRCRSGSAAQARGSRTLLLLRVFGFEQRTHRLLDDLGRRWRHLGAIRLIGAPDAAHATIEPHEFFEFLNGRLSRAFIKDQADLEHRLAASSLAPDPDGLYRIDDFFCHDDTWRMTVGRLARDAFAVLMDLRGFGAANRGCVFEIEELIAAVPVARIVIVVDDTTDLPLLEATLEHAWQIRPAHSPNAGADTHRLRVLRAAGSFRRTLRTLLGLLCESEPREAARPAGLTASQRVPA